MPELYNSYCKGSYQGTYDKLVALQEHIYDQGIYEEALLVMRELTKRVRYNIELLIPRLHTLGYLFGQGLWETPAEKLYWEREAPIYKAPTSETLRKVALLEQLVGPLPLSLKCWYEEVGSVNLVGLFPTSASRTNDYVYGSSLDPLFIYSVDLVLQMIALPLEDETWHDEPLLPLSPDCFHKYHYSGSGPYHIVLPCRMVDTLLLGEPHQTTFVNYLRICLQWAGFPGLEQESRLSKDELSFLTEGLLPF